MKSLMGQILFVVILSCGMITVAHAASETAVPASQTVKGDLLKTEGEFYTVHDTAGHEVRLHVDKTTKLDGTFKTGDKVEAQVTDKSHVQSMKHISQAK